MHSIPDPSDLSGNQAPRNAESGLASANEMLIMIRRCSILLIFLGIFAGGSLGARDAGAQESFQLIPYVRFMMGMNSGYVVPFGEFLVPAGGRPGSGTMIGAHDALMVTTTESSSWGLEAVILDRHRINLDYLWFSPTGVTKTPETFRFQNKTYVADTTVETKLDFNWFRSGYAFDFPSWNGWVFAPKIAVHHVRHGVTINGETEEAGLYSNTRRLDGTYPVLGLDVIRQFPYGFDLRMEFEGVHLITRGYLGYAAIGGAWRFVPDMKVEARLDSRSVHYIEDNQPLNNQWAYTVLGMHAGVSFAF